jgi:hypothetical protein
MKYDNKSNYRYRFACGLRRSGTSGFGAILGALENCTRFENMSDALPGEGQFLQNVYLAGRNLGGPGRIGFNPRAHQTKTSSLLRPENVAGLRASASRKSTGAAQPPVSSTL